MLGGLQNLLIKCRSYLKCKISKCCASFASQYLICFQSVFAARNETKTQQLEITTPTDLVTFLSVKIPLNQIVHCRVVSNCVKTFSFLFLLFHFLFCTILFYCYNTFLEIYLPFETAFSFLIVLSMVHVVNYKNHPCVRCG